MNSGCRFTWCIEWYNCRLEIVSSAIRALIELGVPNDAAFHHPGRYRSCTGHPVCHRQRCVADRSPRQLPACGQRPGSQRSYSRLRHRPSGYCVRKRRTTASATSIWCGITHRPKPASLGIGAKPSSTALPETAGDAGLPKCNARATAQRKVPETASHHRRRQPIVQPTIMTAMSGANTLALTPMPFLPGLCRQTTWRLRKSLLTITLR